MCDVTAVVDCKCCATNVVTCLLSVSKRRPKKFVSQISPVCADVNNPSRFSVLTPSTRGTVLIHRFLLLSL